jgi:hypothetical protein
VTEAVALIKVLPIVQHVVEVLLSQAVDLNTVPKDEKSVLDGMYSLIELLRVPLSYLFISVAGTF